VSIYSSTYSRPSRSPLNFSSIEKTLTTKNDFLSLSKKIEKYSNLTHQNQKKANMLSGTLRSSVKKYGEYKNPLMSNFYSKPFVFKNSDNSLRIAQD